MLSCGSSQMCVIEPARNLRLSGLSLSKCVLPCPVVSEVPDESVAHRPVEMLPLICARDQRKAAQLQVREHAALLTGCSTLPKSQHCSCCQGEDGPGVRLCPG